MKKTMLCVLAATIAGVSPAGASLPTDVQVPFAAYREARGLVVRESEARPAALAVDGAVDVYYEHGGLRVAFTPADAPVLRTDVLERIDGRHTTPLLGGAVDTDLDLSGAYQAELRDASGTPVGWLRVSVAPFDVPRRVYEGRVPGTISTRMLTTALTRLDAEIDAIEARATDVHLGS